MIATLRAFLEEHCLLVGAIIFIFITFISLILSRYKNPKQ
jgi:hypothetical protein